ncbi:MAG: alpha/beta fold hydrolase [Clostridia bacterium]|nr:alpha/beta fold hydrolase [Clostridia bacterium]
MIESENFKIRSDYGEVELFCKAYLPEGGVKEAKGIVEIVHGMCEHIARYDGFMRYLAENGYIAAAHDLRGHGESVKSDEELGYFGDKTGEAVVNDVFKVTKALKERYQNLPVVLLGHSMGAMIVRVFLQEHDKEIEGLIVSGSPSKNALAGAGIALDKTIGLFRGERHRSKMMAALATGNGDKNFPGEGKNAWLTRDKSVVDAYNADKKCGFVFTCNGFENLLRLMKNTYDKKRYRVQNPNLPIFFISGSNDPIMISEDKWVAAQNDLRDAGYQNVSGRLYHEMRHEVLNELKKEEVYADVKAFIDGCTD